MVSSRVIRRVQAVVEVPIKEEDDGHETAYLSEGAHSVRSASGVNTPSKGTTAKRKSTTTNANTNGNGRQSAAATKVRRQSVSSAKGKQSAQYVEIDEETSETSSSSSEEESDYEPQQGGSRRRSGPSNQNEDDDDLLLLSQVRRFRIDHIRTLPYVRLHA